MPIPKTTPPRIQIQEVRPQIDCGRYALKRTMGESVEVTARIFRDGHDTLGAATFRLVHGDDIVATVPPSSLGFRHVGRLLTCARAGAFAKDAQPTADLTDDPPFVRSLVSGLQQGVLDLFAGRLQPSFRDDDLGRLSGLLPPPIADHLPDRYLHALDAA